MDALMFGEKTTTPGGRKLKHACSIRMQVARKAWIEIPNKNPKSTANTEKVGMIMKVKVVHFAISETFGGIESFLYEIYKRSNDENIQMEFVAVGYKNGNVNCTR